MSITPIEKFTCDRCGFDYRKSELRKQRGMHLSHDCFDDLSRIPTHRPRFNPSRDDSTSTGLPASATPEVFTVSAATGINQFFQSHELAERRDGRHISIYMKVVSDGGAITITATDAIKNGEFQGDLLTLKGTSDTDTVTIPPGLNLALKDSAAMTLADGDSISFVFTPSNAGWGSGPWGGFPWGVNDIIWNETSRFKGGV